MSRHEVSKYGVFNIQVCSEGTWDEALEFVRKDCPAGTENNWFKDERPEVAPVQCAEYPHRTHYLFEC